MPRPAPISGPTASTARSRTCSSCRTGSPTSVAGAIEPTLRRAEIERARRKPTESLDAYDLYLRALPLMLTLVPEQNAEALRLLDRALMLDPSYAVAHALKAWCHADRCLRGWQGANEAEERQAAIAAARRALTYGRDDATALAIGGALVAMLDNDIEAGGDCHEPEPGT